MNAIRVAASVASGARAANLRARIVRGVAACVLLGAVLPAPGSARPAQDPALGMRPAQVVEASVLLDQVRDAVGQGRFSDAEALIRQAETTLGTSAVATVPAVSGTPADVLRAALGFERECMQRIRKDFTLDEAVVRERVRKQIPDLTDAEFVGWNKAGLFEHMVIDGKTLYFNRSPSNLFRISKQALARRDPKLPPLGDWPMETLNPAQVAIRDAAIKAGRSGVAPLRLRMTQTLTVKADAVPAGKTVRAWIPYPRAISRQQEHIRFVSSTPQAHELAPESALQRTVAMRKTAQAGKPTEFAVTYEVTLLGQYNTLDPDKVTPAPATAELAPYVQERAPHVVFTPAMRAYSQKVVGDEKNPYRIAQKLFASVDTIPWAGAREYSTIGNIGDYALHAGHADCGQQTLLLITLLRMNGIPARWQSGMVFEPDGTYSNIHDWGQMYLAPYGWVPIDVTTGRLAADKGSGNDPTMEWFYFGGLDNWRIAFNDDWSQPFTPAKQFFRSDTVDSQRGEVEWDGGNLYYDQWDYDFHWERLPLNAGSVRSSNAADNQHRHH